MKRKTMWLATLLVAALLGAGDPASAWQPPIGIPDPGWGVTTPVAPPRPNPWNVQVPGYYYINRQTGSDTQTWGTPASPRATIPSTLPAGTVVEVHGIYDLSQSFTLNGTVTNPVFIRGQDSSTRPTIRRGWSFQGSRYFVLENLIFAAQDQNNTGTLSFEVTNGTIDHAAFRHSDLSGNLNEGGLFIASYSSGTVNHIVVYDTKIHDNGDVNAPGDQDNHGIPVGARVTNLWVLDSEFYRNSGDGIQINATSQALQSTTNHIYVGRNVSHDNKQTGFWSKQAVDVIFSQNTVYSHRPGNSSDGACMGFQYAPHYIWFLYNHLYDCDFGIGTGSDDNGFGTESFFVGNLIHNIHSSNAWDPNNPHQDAAISLRGGVNRYVVNNTIWDYDAGIMAPYNIGFVHIENNILGGRTQSQGRDIFIEGALTAAASNMRNNIVFGAPLRIEWGGALYTTMNSFQSGTGKGQNSLNTNPLFVSQATNNYRLQAGSPAIDVGITQIVYATFLARYGMSIAFDFDGVTRPQGSSFDMGAFESGGGGGATAPQAPSNLQVQ